MQSNRVIGNPWFVYCVILMWTHGVAIAIFYEAFFGPETYLTYFGLYLLIVAPVPVGLNLKTWRQFGAYFFITLAVWQVSPWVLDWAVGRLSEQGWWEDRIGTWPGEILWRSLYPSALVCGTALLGRLRIPSRLR